MAKCIWLGRGFFITLAHAILGVARGEGLREKKRGKLLAFFQHLSLHI